MSSNEASESMSEESSNNPLKKQIRKKILEQLEFYFSDSNLTKDRFLKQEIQNSTDGCKNFFFYI